MHESAVDSAAWVIISAVNERGAMEDDFDHHHGGVLTELDLVVDACLEKVTCKYEYGADVSVLLTYAQEAPGALQVSMCCMAFCVHIGCSRLQRLVDARRLYARRACTHESMCASICRVCSPVIACGLQRLRFVRISRSTAT